MTTTPTRSQVFNYMSMPGPVMAVGCALFLTMVSTGTASAAPKEAGIWYDDSGKGAIELVPCGDRLCGRIMWLREPLNDQGQPKTDRLNPKSDNRNRPICGLQVIGGLQRQDDGSWDSGWIYDPKQGSAFDLAAQLVSKDQLQITGYKGVKLFSKTFLWTRAPADLPRCDAPAEQQTGLPPAAKSQAAKPAQQKAGTQNPDGQKSGAVAAPAPKPAKRPVEPAAADAAGIPQPAPTKKTPPAPAVE
jgi:uncharacterized protein (DUF2147 family)